MNGRTADLTTLRKKLANNSRAFNNSVILDGVASKIAELAGTELAEFNRQLDEILSKRLSPFESARADLTRGLALAPRRYLTLGNGTFSSVSVCCYFSSAGCQVRSTVRRF
jgi:hypothetical protein